jgi:hypothetical protein
MIVELFACCLVNDFKTSSAGLRGVEAGLSIMSKGAFGDVIYFSGESKLAALVLTAVNGGT